MFFSKKKVTDFFHYLYFVFFFYLFRKDLKYMDSENKNIIKIATELELNIPRKIWIFWYDLDMPEFVGYCVKNVRKLHLDYEVYVLNKDNVTDYLDIDVSILMDKMPIANLSDFIRLKLLQKYGGIWMDSSIILDKNIEEFFLVKKNIFEIIGFYNAYQSEGCRFPVLESWFLAAPKDSKFINAWLSYFEPISELGSVALFENFKKHPDFDELCKGLGDPSYLVVYIAEKLAYKDMLDKCNMLFYCCDDSAFSVQIYSKWLTRKCIVNLYIRDKFVFSPIYKLTSGDRKYYDFLKKNNLINKKSIIGSFLGRMNRD